MAHLCCSGVRVSFVLGVNYTPLHAQTTSGLPIPLNQMIQQFYVRFKKGKTEISPPAVVFHSTLKESHWTLQTIGMIVVKGRKEKKMVNYQTHVQGIWLSQYTKELADIYVF